MSSAPAAGDRTRQHGTHGGRSHLSCRDVDEPTATAIAASAQAPEKWLTGVRLQIGGENGTLSFEGSS
ncbi:MAG: hypothetical protein A3F70_04935 [Acidobacteria bacterium RIFCSPLOWO2_12_FULL_67_14]|nr:MAG: hypothetical protein A3H29_02645 [Acidobacteria bacterium RIFCSPLOWO2_02_FULL_67_21]OFW37798.1 MAG: hypothetical protein A3F70_04935 [Acidobacteria bacterium RIFCSPLOWO2_12_FULL_67_14]